MDLLPNPPRFRTMKATLAVLLLAMVSIGCVEQADLPDDCDASAVQREASLSGDRLDPEGIDVCKGQEVTIDIASERDGELHLHGYDEEVEAAAGETATFELTATRSGQFVIELHSHDDGSEIEVGLLTVHEP
jgi:hypothetical protein